MFEIDIHLMHKLHIFPRADFVVQNHEANYLEFCKLNLQVLLGWFQRRKDFVVERIRCIDMTLMGMSAWLNTW
jgi:hypothetical protein